jgi:integrase
MNKQRKAPRQFGTIELLPSGKYRPKYYDRKSGKRISARDTFLTKADADTWLATQQADRTRGTWQDYRVQTPPLSEYGLHIITTKPSLRPKSREDYQRLWVNHIAPHLGTIRVADLSVTQVNAWHSERQRQGVGARTLSQSYSLLRMVMNCAIAEELRQANPCKIVGAGSANSPERPYLSPEQVQLLADTVQPRYRALVYVIAYCLLRKGEATALRRSDLTTDLRNGRWSVSISRTVQTKPGGGWRIGSPKTKAGVRSISIPEFLVPILQEHWELYCQPGQDSLLFTSRNGVPAYEAVGRDIEKALDKIGLSYIKGIKVHTHDLRHTGATWLIQSGATVPELQRCLGDSSPSMAMHYAHAHGDLTHLTDRLNDLHMQVAR